MMGRSFVYAYSHRLELALWFVLFILYRSHTWYVWSFQLQKGHYYLLNDCVILDFVEMCDLRHGNTTHVLYDVNVNETVLPPTNDALLPGSQHSRCDNRLTHIQFPLTTNTLSRSKMNRKNTTEALKMANKYILVIGK